MATSFLLYVSLASDARSSGWQTRTNLVTFQRPNSNPPFRTRMYRQLLRPLQRRLLFCPKKLTSCVCNDQRCESGDVGLCRKIGRPAKMAWKKYTREIYPGVIATSGGTDPILSTRRIPRGRDRVFIYTFFHSYVSLAEKHCSQHCHLLSHDLDNFA